MMFLSIKIQIRGSSSGRRWEMLTLDQEVDHRPRGQAVTHQMRHGEE